MIEYLRIGKIIKTHGIKGEVKVFSTTDDIKRYDILKKFYVSKKEEASIDDLKFSAIYEVENVKYLNDAPVIKIKGIDNIESTLKLIGQNIYVSRKDAIKLKSNEYFISDFIGLMVYEKDKSIGEVTDIMKSKTQDILVINSDGKQKLIPLVYEFIEKIDIDSKKIYIKTIEGLL